MSTVDEVLRQLTEDWHELARYRVYVSAWFPKKTRTVIASGLTYEQAKQRAAAEYILLAQRDPRVRGRFGDPSVEIELDNREAMEARRHARITASAATFGGGSVKPAQGPTDGIANV